MTTTQQNNTTHILLLHWINEEMRLKTNYMIWMIKSILLDHSTYPQASVGYLQLPLQCSENVFHRTYGGFLCSFPMVFSCPEPFAQT